MPPALIQLGTLFVDSLHIASSLSPHHQFNTRYNSGDRIHQGKQTDSGNFFAENEEVKVVIILKPLIIRMCIITYYEILCRFTNDLHKQGSRGSIDWMIIQRPVWDHLKTPEISVRSNE